MEEMEEELRSAEKEDAEEVKKWRGLSQSEIDQSWKNLAERMEEEILNKYKVEESNKEALTRTSAPLEWRRVRKNKKYKIKMWWEIAWRELSLCSENTICSVCKASRRSRLKKRR